MIVRTPLNRIKEITITECESGHRSGLVSRDCGAALRDLVADSYFQPHSDESGPYSVHLSIEENRLIFRIRNDQAHDLPILILSLKPYQRLIKDYFLIVNSYDQAVLDGKPSRIEAIDMGRRGLHNEGAALLMERLESRIAMDLDTARRLFTLICGLHDGRAIMWR